MRCPDCSKFVSMENEAETTQDTEISVDDHGFSISVTVDVVRNCADCSTELKRGSFEMEESVPIEEGCKFRKQPESTTHGHELEVEAEDPEVSESGGGRYKKNMIGAEISYTVKCSNEGCQYEHKGTLTDEMAAGSFDESV